MAAHVRMKFEKTGIRTNRDLVDHARMYSVILIGIDKWKMLQYCLRNTITIFLTDLCYIPYP